MKETESYIEKDRTFRDRSKKKRLTVDEKRELANDLKPKHQPYHRKKQHYTLVEDEYDPFADFCAACEKYYEDDGFGCPYCGDENLS